LMVRQFSELQQFAAPYSLGPRRKSYEEVAFACRGDHRP
jgi:hypothetical protein